MAIDITLARVERELKHTSPLIGCRFDPSGRFLFATSQDESIVRFDTTSDDKLSLVGHKSWARGLAFLPNHTLLSADYHGKLFWWESDATKPTRTIDAHDGWVRAVAVSPDGSTIATCGNDRHVKLWTADGKPIQTLDGHASHVYNVAFHPDPAVKLLVSVDHKGILKDWDLQSGKCVRDLDAKALHIYDPRFYADIGGARGIAFDNRDGKVRLAVCGITNVSNAFAGIGNPLVILFDWADGKPKQLKPKDAFQGTGWGVAFHPENYVILAAGGSGGRVFFWKDDESTSMHEVKVPIGARDLAVKPGGDQFAVAGANGTAYLYGFTPAPKVEKKPAPVKPKK